MRAALYARVSTAHNGQSPEMQLTELREYCQRRAWTVAGEYVDVEHGNVDSRPQLDALFTKAKMRRFDAVTKGTAQRACHSLPKNPTLPKKAISAGAGSR